MRSSRILFEYNMQQQQGEEGPQVDGCCHSYVAPIYATLAKVPCATPISLWHAVVRLFYAYSMPRGCTLAITATHAASHIYAISYGAHPDVCQTKPQQKLRGRQHASQQYSSQPLPLFVLCLSFALPFQRAVFCCTLLNHGRQCIFNHILLVAQS